MRIENKKLISVSILIFTLLLLFANIAYAKPLTEAFKGVLIKINDFFEKEQYKAYSKAIDFFIFALIFTAIYMRGVKFAFKEVKRTEKVIAIVLGLTTAFLMVLRDYSIVVLLPFVNWFLYFLLFVVIWWLLKDMKSKLGRFLLALLLTLLIIALIQLVFGAFTPDISQQTFNLCALPPFLILIIAIILFTIFLILFKEIKNSFLRFILALLLTLLILLLFGWFCQTTTPEVTGPLGGFIGSFVESFKSIDFSKVLRIPQALRELTTVPTPETPTPKEKKPEIDESWFGRMWNVDPKIFADQGAYDKTVKEKIYKEEIILGDTKYYPKEEKGKDVLYKCKTTIWFFFIPYGCDESVVDSKDYEKVYKQKLEEDKKKSGKPSSAAQTKFASVLSDAGNPATWLVIIAFIIAVFLRVRGGWGKKVKDTLRSEGGFIGYKKLTIPEIITQIEEICKKKNRLIQQITTANRIKNEKLKSDDIKVAYIIKLKKDLGKLWLPKPQDIIQEGEETLEELLKQEGILAQALQGLKDVEYDFSKKFVAWREFLGGRRIGVSQYSARFEEVVTGAKPLIAEAIDFERREEIIELDLRGLLNKDKIKELVQGKFDKIEPENKALEKYISRENEILRELELKVKQQIQTLLQLRVELEKLEAHQTSTVQMAQTAKPAPEMATLALRK